MSLINYTGFFVGLFQCLSKCALLRANIVSWLTHLDFGVLSRRTFDNWVLLIVIVHSCMMTPTWWPKRQFVLPLLKRSILNTKKRRSRRLSNVYTITKVRNCVTFMPIPHSWLTRERKSAFSLMMQAFWSIMEYFSVTLFHVWPSSLILCLSFLVSIFILCIHRQIE